ncbi:hypothetical protein C8A00DRAFT_34326 [Chaetomidium leptoderma]|uniref:NACHT domain-containing protein n=1 Tax=Chaetomidium leptoderma TaxID=669021 RepID=A0AAN6VKQ3_9PEZI|nr:hypothetical protein C8A00DRAFT_34326 [Chaetomidium leptoderma]
MEALAAISLMGNVLQFAQFVSGLIATSGQLYMSADGVSDVTADMERIHRRLLNFSAMLQNQVATAQVVPELPTTIGLTHINAVNDLANDLARECKALCDQLLETTGKLRVGRKGNRRLNSFVTAFKTVWNRDRIESLYVRLDRFQSIVSMQFLPVLSTQQSSLMDMVEMLRQESNNLKLDQTKTLDCIARALSEVASTNKKLSLRAENALGSDRNPLLQDSREAFLSPSSLDSLSRGISRLALTKGDLEVVAKEQAVLRSLNFSSRPVRHDNIPLAHEKTFRWILEPPPDGHEDHDGSDRSKYRFLDWLRGGDGIFWVSGKAGSGKSTLMKFLADHETTRATLEEWASPLKPLIATHYFWSAGTRMQKSHEGLLKTLLYEIFRACPVLIPATCPLRWRQTHPGRSEQNTDWTTRELSEALQNLGRHRELHVRYCFFIDGVDEFDGDHLRLCEILQNLGRSPNIKLCLSSRPWNVFVDAFGAHVARKICIEDLTRDDILRYAESRLTEHPRWNLAHFPAQDKTAIIDDITNKAQGVFLWVFLVTRSLRDGLTNLDTMLDLRNRLESLPTDLERFFKHMLDLIDGVYYQKMASFLSIAANAKQPLYYLVFTMQEREGEDEDYAAKMPISPPPQADETDQLFDRCRRRVNAICGGLLGVKGSSVEFLHRTVRDFLLTREMSDYLGSKTRPGFSIALSTLRAYTACLKCSPQPVTSAGSPCPLRSRLLEECLSYANEALEDADEIAIELLDGIENIFAAPLEEEGGGGEYALGWKLLEPGKLDGGHGGHNVMGDVNFWNASSDFQFRKEVLRAGAAKYVSRKLDESPNYFDDLNELPLSTVIGEQQWTEGHMQVIRCLLDLGQDPNKGYCYERQSTSPWTSFIQRTCQEEHKDDFHAAIENGLYSTFLQRGASRDAQVVLSAESAALDVLSYFVETLFARYAKHSDKALRILDDFFDLSAGAQLSDEVLITLCAEVGKIGPRTTRPDKLRFYQKITEMVDSFKGLQVPINCSRLAGINPSFSSAASKINYPCIAMNIDENIVGLGISPSDASLV